MGIERSAENFVTESASIRALGRGLRLLQIINQHAPISLMGLSRRSGYAYATTRRIVQTLVEEGMIEREPGRKRYRPTMLVRTLSHGFQDSDELVAVARPHIVELCQQVGWPITVASRVGARMMLRDSTHAMTSLTLSN